MWSNSDRPLSWAPDFLRQVRTTSIKTVFLAFERHLSDRYLGLDVLRDIAAALTGRTFGTLEKVIVHLCDHRMEDLEEQGVLDTIRTHLAQFRARGMLRIECVPTKVGDLTVDITLHMLTTAYNSKVR